MKNDKTIGNEFPQARKGVINRIGKKVGSILSVLW